MLHASLFNQKVGFHEGAWENIKILPTLLTHNATSTQVTQIQLEQKSNMQEHVLHEHV